MTYKEKDLMLRQYREDVIRLRGLVQEAERWEQIAMSTAISSEYSSGGGNTGGRVQTAATNAADIVQDIRRDMDGIRAERQEVRRLVEGVQNRRQKMLLELRYINGLTVDQIANEIGKSHKWTRESLWRAVNALNM
ncbi:MAG TPA: DUF1492 domain-containing protein [Candidatus Merdisoma merdipullorum]|nr:DUF1492 domain-containing protein [Candidatus Merdisoma merdipullorum]